MIVVEIGVESAYTQLISMLVLILERKLATVLVIE
jgi:hypothetical protein